VALLSDGVSPWVMGGIQRHSRMLAISLARAGARVSLFHSVRSGEATAAAETLADFPAGVRPQITSHLVPYPKAGRLPGHYVRDSAVYSGNMLNRYLGSGTRAHFIYAQGLTGSAFAAARRRDPRSLPPVGVNQHGYEMFQSAADVKTWLQHRMLRPAFRNLARRADWVFSFPGKIRRIVEDRCGVRPAKIIELPNGIEAEWVVPELPARPGRRRFVFVGRHERRKGLPELMEAIDDASCREAEFHFVGPIPEAVRCRADNVHYHGPISDPEALKAVLDGCHVLVCPSFAEGMPTVVLEAMSRGLAVIATDVGATSAWVDAANGVLLPGPTVAGIRRAIGGLAAVPDATLRALQAESVRRASHFTWDGIGADTLAAIAARIP
jgi:glycosyltransferase involved in cell wall biosynthesis